MALLALKRPLTQEENRLVREFMQRAKTYSGRGRSSAVSRSASAASESLYLQRRRRSRGRQKAQQQQQQQEEKSEHTDESRRFVSKFIASEAANMAAAKLGVNGGQRSRRVREGEQRGGSRNRKQSQSDLFGDETNGRRSELYEIEEIES